MNKKRIPGHKLGKPSNSILNDIVMFVKTLAEIGETTSNAGLLRALVWLSMIAGFLWFIVRVLGLSFGK